MSHRKTGEDLWQEVTARITERSERKVSATHCRTTYYYPKLDGTVWFSTHHTAVKDGEISYHCCGSLVWKDVKDLRERHPDWFERE